jgi:ElaA protein
MNFFSKSFSELTNDELYGILKARFQIFVTEQKYLRLDPDGADPECLHCFIKNGDTVVACLRAQYTDSSKTEVKIGRIVTLNHGGGIGRLLMTESISAIKEKMPFTRLYVHSRDTAVGYYEKMGFTIASDEFDDCGATHIEMEYKGR